VSYNGSGTFNINSAGQPVVTGTVISSTAFNALTADLGTGLSTAITKDGQTVATARIPFAAGINSSLVTDATNTTTGSIITAGGVGIAKALFVGTTANIAGTTTLAGVTATSITDSGLTAGRVTYAGTAGLLQDSANLLYSGTDLTVYGVTVGRGTGAVATNTAVGYQAGYLNTTGNHLTAVGYTAGYSCTGNDNTFYGWQAGYGVTSGTNNICIGSNAGNYTTALTTGAQSIYLGTYSTASSSSVTYEMVIGYGTTGKGANTGFINMNSGGVYQGNNLTTWSTTSDQRLKKNIVDNNVGLEKITAIQVRNFEYRLPEEVDAALKPSDAIQKEGVQLGVIAQELQAVLPDCVKTESTGVMSVNSDALMWHMINAIKELSAKVTALEAK
tara:strand:- start:257 stop:1420 length:1164 start_codon:yes stop_codon:yes gene_type:complete